MHIEVSMNAECSARRRSNMNKRVAVVGAGAVGQVVAGALSEAGHAVTLMAREARVADLRASGLRLRKGQEAERKVPVEVVAALDASVRWDILFVAVRAEQLRETLATLEAAGVHGELLVLCTALWGTEPAHRLNGFGDTLLLLPGLLAGEESGVIRYRLSKTSLGPLTGPITPAARELTTLLRSAGLPAKARADLVERYVVGLALALPWAVAVEQSGFDLGALARNRDKRRAVANATREAVQVARRRERVRGMALAELGARCSGQFVGVGGRALAPLTRRGWGAIAWNHLKKIAPQNRALLEELHRFGRAQGAETPALDALVG
jgi:2-dehydropantoate 2-reductase